LFFAFCWGGIGGSVIQISEEQKPIVAIKELAKVFAPLPH